MESRALTHSSQNKRKYKPVKSRKKPLRRRKKWGKIKLLRRKKLLLNRRKEVKMLLRPKRSTY